MNIKKKMAFLLLQVQNGFPHNLKIIGENVDYTVKVKRFFKITFSFRCDLQYSLYPKIFFSAKV